MEIKYFESYEKMSEQAAEIVANEIKAKPTKNFVLGLPTGSTPLGMYANLIEKNKSGLLDFSKVTTFNLDEYYPIKHDNDQSYYKFMFDNLFGSININHENINIPDGEAVDAGSECESYEEKIKKSGGIDLMVIGIGPNGHIGFNEPDNFLLPDTHIAVLTEETKEANKRFFDSVEQVPDKALTMGMGSILKAKKILMLVSGKSKTEIFKKFLQGEISTSNPSSFLHLHNDVTVLSDVGI